VWYSILMTQTYWHIAHPTYTEGDLICRNELGNDAPAWQWDEAPEGFDGDVVCLFPDTPRGRTEAAWLWYERADCHLLRIDIPADADVTITQVDEGYPAVRSSIPAECITHIRTGHADRIVTREGDTY